MPSDRPVPRLASCLARDSGRAFQQRMERARYHVGIDLGTTNSSVAIVDALALLEGDTDAAVSVLPVRQECLEGAIDEPAARVRRGGGGAGGVVGGAGRPRGAQPGPPAREADLLLHEVRDGPGAGALLPLRCVSGVRLALEGGGPGPRRAGRGGRVGGGARAAGARGGDGAGLLPARRSQGLVPGGGARRALPLGGGSPRRAQRGAPRLPADLPAAVGRRALLRPVAPAHDPRLRLRRGNVRRVGRAGARGPRPAAPAPRQPLDRPLRAARRRQHRRRDRGAGAAAAAAAAERPRDARRRRSRRSRSGSSRSCCPWPRR